MKTPASNCATNLLAAARIAIRCAVLIFVAMLAAGGTTQAAEAPYCAFEIAVKSPNGTPLARVPVIMITDHRETFSEEPTDARGVARLCDSPITPIDIVVGFDICGSVTIRNVQATWPTTVRLSVIYAEMRCDHFALSPQCRVLIRLSDEDGRPLAGAHFDGHVDGHPLSASDALGRIFGSVRRRTKIQGTLRMDAHQPASVSEICTDDIELKIRLRRR